MNAAINYCAPLVAGLCILFVVVVLAICLIIRFIRFLLEEHRITVIRRRIRRRIQPALAGDEEARRDIIRFSRELTRRGR